ncbi:heme uptake protein IsdC [Paenibacillus wulumuqiensis]|uniref:heme uptake protein IsdC n=1 Tax=Paenibacillus wulumuqiensis TaxID=1567107 RepID=UPI0006190EA5|nr:heme uptake protein IsdC [Paenibacillus wulumuqiensis]
MSRKYALPVLWMLTVIMLIIGAVPSSATAASSSRPAKGTYTIDYDILRAEDNSVSMANDYFEKPARLYVTGSKMTMQITVNHSAWTTKFKVKYKGKIVDTRVIKTNKAKDTRVVQFPIADLNSPMISQIHVTVPSYNYDHDYTIRFKFDRSSLKKSK